MADQTEQTAREDAGVSAEDLAALKKRAESAEASAHQAAQVAGKLAQERDQAIGRASEEIGRRVQADEAALVQAISAATSEGDAAEREYAEAVGANDAGAMAKAQRRMTSATIHLEQAQGQHGQLQNWKRREAERAVQAEEQRRQNEEVARAQPPRQAQPQQGADIDISNFTGPTQEWLKKHPHLIKNTEAASRQRSRVIAAHYEAEADGLVADTPSYFAHLEKRAAPPTQQQDNNGGPYSQAADTLEINLEKQAPEPRQEQRQTAALPPSRSSSPANGSARGKVSLTVSEQNAARISWPHLKPEEAYREYAINKLELQAEGRM